MTTDHAPAPAPAPPARPEPARGSLRLLTDPVFGPFFAGKIVSTAGIWVFNIVAAILTFELTRSAFMVGMVTVFQFIPQTLLAPLSGALADRVDRRLQVVAGKMTVAITSAVLAIWIAMVGVEGLPGVWPVMAAALIVGFGFLLITPAENALLPALVRPNELTPAVSLNTIPPTLARGAGPAIGALVAATLGPATAFAITAVTNGLFCLVMLSIKVEGRAPIIAGADRRIRVGVQQLSKDRRILPLLIGIAAISLGADPAITLTPSMSAGYGAGSTLVGLFASAFGVGAGVVFIVLPMLGRRFGLGRLGPAGLLILAFGMAATGISPTPAIAVISLAVAGAGMTVALTSLTTQMQQWVPDEIRGRVMSLWSVAFLGTRPIAAAINGALADATSPGLVMLLVALVVAAAAWRCRPGVITRMHGQLAR